MADPTTIEQAIRCISRITVSLFDPKFQSIYENNITNLLTGLNSSDYLTSINYLLKIQTFDQSLINEEVIVVKPASIIPLHQNDFGDFPEFNFSFEMDKNEIDDSEKMKNSEYDKPFVSDCASFDDDDCLEQYENCECNDSDMSEIIDNWDEFMDSNFPLHSIF